MRILSTTVSLDAERGGGTAERTRRLARHLALAGEKVCVLSIDDGSLVEALRNDGVDVHVTRLARRKPAIPVLPLRKLWSLVRRSDVIHILGYWNLLSVATAAFARWTRTPYVLSPAGEFAELQNLRPIHRLFHETLGRPVIRGAAKIISITDLERQQIIDRFGRSPTDVITIPNGIENDPSAERRRGL